MTHIYLKREKNPDNYKYRSGNTYFLFVNFYNAQLTSHDTSRNTCDVTPRQKSGLVVSDMAMCRRPTYITLISCWELSFRVVWCIMDT